MAIDPTNGELRDTVAIVTGSARNIGRAIALELSSGGAAVVVHAKSSKDEAEAVAREIQEKGGRAMVHLADLSQPESASKMVEAVLNEFGRLDILVNNAARRGDAPIEKITFESWCDVIGSILNATFLCSQACIPHLSAHGRGAIVNIGGVSGHAGVGGRAHVAAAKAGIAGLTRGLADELAARGITVNCVSPGYINTKRDHVPQHFLDRPVPLQRPGMPEEIAAAVRYLAGPSARFVTGHTLHVNGGWYMA